MGSIFGKAKRGFGKALKPRGPGVLRPKPTDRYGQPMKPKPIRPGKKAGGMTKGVKEDSRRDQMKQPLKRKGLKPVDVRQKGLKKLPTQVRNKMGYMKDGGKAKKFPDLTGDGKVTRADVLKGRGVFAAGGKVPENIKKRFKKNPNIKEKILPKKKKNRLEELRKELG